MASPDVHRRRSTRPHLSREHTVEGLPAPTSRRRQELMMDVLTGSFRAKRHRCPAESWATAVSYTVANLYLFARTVIRAAPSSLGAARIVTVSSHVADDRYWPSHTNRRSFKPAAPRPSRPSSPAAGTGTGGGVRLPRTNHSSKPSLFAKSPPWAPNVEYRYT